MYRTRYLFYKCIVNVIRGAPNWGVGKYNKDVAQVSLSEALHKMVKRDRDIAPQSRKNEAATSVTNEVIAYYITRERLDLAWKQGHGWGRWGDASSSEVTL